jgi:exosortase D (VPLPA-CTERM-specific)
MNSTVPHTDQARTQYLLVGAILASFIIGFRSALTELTIRWDSGDNSYCYLIIPIFLYLCWEQRKTFHYGDFSLQPLGLIPVILALGLIFLGEFGSVETLVYAGVLGCIIGTFIYLYGRRTRSLLFAFTILVFIVPLPPYLNNLLTFKLKMFASAMAATLLRLSGVSVFVEGNIIDLGGNLLQVVDACSGLRYVVPMLLMALLIGQFFSNRFWKKLLLVLAVLPLTILINGLRIYLTGMLTVWGHPELAENFFHDLAGVVFFLLAGGVLLNSARALNKLGAPPISSPYGSGRQIIGTKIIPFMAGTMLLCLLFWLGSFALSSHAKNLVVPARKTFALFPTEIGGWQGAKIKLPQEILDELWADDYIDLDFTRAGQANHIFMLIPYYGYQETRHTAHAPESCLLGSGWSILDSKRTDIEVAPGKEVPVMKSIMLKGDQRLISLYFFLQRGQVITSPWHNKLQLMLGAMRDRRTDGALVRIEMTVDAGQSMEQKDLELQEFFKHLWPLLPEYVPA